MCCPANRYASHETAGEQNGFARAAATFAEDVAAANSARSPATRRKEQPVADPTQTDPDKYKVVFENERVRVLEYRDEPGQRTSPHEHPDSVMVTLSGFDRRLIGEGGESRDVTLERGLVRWLDAQTHSGENIGTRPTHVVFVELKEPTERERAGRLGPS
jgi:quercetin dioxygenase-like cupin family protein